MQARPEGLSYQLSVQIQLQYAPHNDAVIFHVFAVHTASLQIGRLLYVKQQQVSSQAVDMCFQSSFITNCLFYDGIFQSSRRLLPKQWTYVCDATLPQIKMLLLQIAFPKQQKACFKVRFHLFNKMKSSSFKLSDAVFIRASLSQPHTSELNAGFSYIYIICRTYSVCLFRL